MKQATIMLTVLGALIAGNPSVRADSGNPFGFETDKHPLEYEYCKKEPGFLRDHGYTCSSAPRPHPDLEEYNLQFVEDVGLCFIAGVRRSMLNSSPSSKRLFPSKKLLKSNMFPLINSDSFEMFYRQIVKKYGSPTSRQVGFLGEKVGQVGDLDDLGKPDIYDWDSAAGFKGLGDVKNITLLLTALTHEPSLTLYVYFWLVTSDACQKKIDDKADRAF